MATIHDVENFLRDFKTKSQIFDIFFRDARQKNTQALLDLELSPLKRREIVDAIVATEYSEGPIDDDLNGIVSLWEIKITLPFVFHLAEYAMSYPFK